MLPHFEHKEMKDNDCGLPNHPISSNYTKYLWNGHKRSGGVEVPDQKPATGSDRKASDLIRGFYYLRCWLSIVPGDVERDRCTIDRGVIDSYFFGA